MLRRTKTIVLGDDSDAEGDFEAIDVVRPSLRRDRPADGTARDDVGAMRAEIERAFGSAEAAPRPASAGFDAESESPEAAPQDEAVARPAVERRKTERRGMDALREEALRNVISMVEDRDFGGLRRNVQWRSKFPVARIAFLAVAVLAGGVAVFLATQNTQPPAEPELPRQPAVEIVKEPRAQILVAREPIGIGQRLSPSSLEWQDWPEGAVRSDYITVAMVPDAIPQMTGSVARYEIFPGEPIREQKLVQGGEGVLSAVLGSGKRGVSVSVAAASASGGFILPNDHVDVVLTRSTSTDPLSETILHNVRVLAVGAKLAEAPTAAEPEGPGVFEGEAIATLELGPAEAEVIIGAANAGRLSLVLRSILDFAEATQADYRPANQVIRMSSPFWSN